MNKKDYKTPYLTLLDLETTNVLSVSGDNAYDNDGTDIGGFIW